MIKTPDWRIIEDCRQLSSGTIASLTGETNYAKQDVIREEFRIFTINAIQTSPNTFDSWVDIWEAFKATKPKGTYR